MNRLLFRRYDISGVRTFLGNRGYNGSISYVEAEGSKFDVHDQCLSDCSVCQNTSKISQNSQKSQNTMSTANDVIESIVDHGGLFEPGFDPFAKGAPE